MAEPLLLIPGMMCDGRLFGPQIAALERERPVLVADITGQETVPELAAHVLKTAPPTFAVAGLSMGGIVAMEMMAQAPARITRLALMDTNPKAEHPAVRESREPQIAKAQSGNLRAVMRDEMKPRYLSDGPRRAEILDLCMEMALALGPDVFVRQSRALQTRPDQQDVLRAVTARTLILCGAEDTLCPLSRHNLMKDLIPHAHMVVVDRAGHLPTLEQEGVTTGALRDWLAE